MPQTCHNSVVLDCTISGVMKVYCSARSAGRELENTVTTADKCVPHVEHSSEGKYLKDPNLFFHRVLIFPSLRGTNRVRNKDFKNPAPEVSEENVYN